MDEVIPLAVFGSACMFLLVSFRHSALLVKLNPRKIVLTKTKPSKKYNQLAVLMETPDFISLLWFAIASGEPLDTAIRIATSRSKGYFCDEFSKMLVKVDHGSLLQHELENLAAESKSAQIRELAAKLAISLYNGSALAEQLAEFAGSANDQLRSALLDKAGKSETKMMIPLVFIILPVTVMFALFPSLVIIQRSFL